jgi:GT2 family glycosyltransferase
MAASTGRVLAFTDADCRPDAGWLAAGVAALAGGASLAGGAIRLDRSDGSMWATYDRATYLDQRRYVEVDGFAATANLFVAASVVAEVGSFDAGLVSSGDVEFCRRATAAGHRLVYAPDAIVRHPTRSTRQATWRLHRRLGAGRSQMAARRGGPSPWRDPALRIGVGAVAAATDGEARRRDLWWPHTVAMAARWTGRLTGRP